MSTLDQTLSQFLQQFNVGTPIVFTDEQLLKVGCAKSETNDHEIINFELARAFELGELTALAASYLIRLRFKEVHVTQLTLGIALRDDNCHTSLVGGRDCDGGRMQIQVSYNDSIAQFVKSQWLTPPTPTRTEKSSGSLVGFFISQLKNKQYKKPELPRIFYIYVCIEIYLGLAFALLLRVNVYNLLKVYFVIKCYNSL